MLARVINSMVEFKQVIGRGMRLRDDYGKYFFNIIDFMRSTRLFADPEFDGEPALITEIQMDDVGVEEPVQPQSVAEFGGVEGLRAAVAKMQMLLYAA